MVVKNDFDKKKFINKINTDAKHFLLRNRVVSCHLQAAVALISGNIYYFIKWRICLIELQIIKSSFLKTGESH